MRAPTFLQSTSLVAVLVSVCITAANALAREWHFDVTADGFAIGTHRIVVHESGDTKQVTSDMRFGLLGMNAYQQHAEESWNGDCLTRIATRTEEKGTVTTVAGRADNGAFRIEQPAPATLPACVMSFAYWNPRVLTQAHLVNAQTGAWTPVKVAALGSESIDVHGTRIAANHFRIETERNDIELWYSAAGEWLGLKSTTRTGSHVLSYRLR
jgi:hypothetical protein